MTRWTKSPAARRRAFLAALAATGNITLAAERADVPRPTLYVWRKRLPEFAAAWAEALETGTDALEDVAVQRAVAGTPEPVFYQGTQVATQTRVSDSLLMFLLKSRRPEKFRTGPAPVGSDGKPVKATITVTVRGTDHDDDGA